MFIRIQVSARRKEHLSKDAPRALVSWEKEYPDDLVGELQAADDGHKAVDAAIDKLAAEEARARGD